MRRRHPGRTNHHLVVLADDDVEVARLAAERLGLLVNLKGSRGHLEAEQQEVLHLTQQAHERGVEVDGEELRVDLAVALLGAREQRQLELGLRAALDVRAPLLDLLVLVVVEGAHRRRVHLRGGEWQGGGVIGARTCLLAHLQHTSPRGPAHLHDLLGLLAVHDVAVERADLAHGLDDCGAGRAAGEMAGNRRL